MWCVAPLSIIQASFWAAYKETFRSLLISSIEALCIATCVLAALLPDVFSFSFLSFSSSFFLLLLDLIGVTLAELSDDPDQHASSLMIRAIILECLSLSGVPLARIVNANTL